MCGDPHGRSISDKKTLILIAFGRFHTGHALKPDIRPGEEYVTIGNDDPEAQRRHRERLNEDRSDEADELLSEERRMAQLAEGILRQRRRRTDYFRASMFSEAGWDMLLELYVRDSCGASATAAQLLMAATTPTSTAARWLDYLEAEGLVVRRGHPLDPGTEFIELTDKAWQAMEAYLTAVR